MDSRISQILIDSAPRFFQARDGSRTRFSSYYFECREGWAPLLLRAFIKIEALIDRPEFDGFYPTQIKEKFGALRLYTSFFSEAARDIIIQAERSSEITCEFCGSPGELIETDNWYRTACEDPLHRDPRKYSQAEQDAETERVCAQILITLKLIRGDQ